MNELWRQQMRQKMADYRRSAPEVSWDEIDKALTTQKRSGNWRIGIAASLLIVAGVILQTLPHTSHDRANHHQSSTNSPAIRPTIPSSVEEPKQDIPLVAQVTESPKPRKQVRRQTVPHKTAVEVSHQEELLEMVEERATPVDVQDNDELEAMLNSVRSNQSAISAEDEYRHMNVRVFTANIRIRNTQEN